MKVHVIISNDNGHPYVDSVWSELKDAKKEFKRLQSKDDDGWDWQFDVEYKLETTEVQ